MATDLFSGKKLAGDLLGFYSVRLTHKDRMVYSVDETTRTIYISSSTNALRRITIAALSFSPDSVMGENSKREKRNGPVFPFSPCPDPCYPDRVMAETLPPSDNSQAAEKVRSFPATPGVYLMKDNAGRIIYVGKAKNLRAGPAAIFSRPRPKTCGPPGWCRKSATSTTWTRKANSTPC